MPGSVDSSCLHQRAASVVEQVMVRKPAEDHPPLQLGGRVVEVDDHPRGALEALVGALDQFLAALGEHLDGDVLRDQVLFDELADEVVVGLRRGREADLDLLEADLEQDVPEA